MALSESVYLLNLWEKNVCPFCKKQYDARGRVGSGRKRDGGFCSLACYTGYYELDLRERARRIQQDYTVNRKQGEEE